MPLRRNLRELLIILVVLGVGIFFFLKGNTQRGVNTVRAYVFLNALKAGTTTEEANKRASYDVANGPTQTMRAALNYARQHYSGQIDMINDAKRQGLAVELGHGAVQREPLVPPVWVRPFALYYVASEMQFVRDEMPVEIAALATEQMNTHVQLSLLGALSNYLPHAFGRDATDSDLKPAWIGVVTFLQGELAALNTPMAAKRLIRRMHQKDGEGQIAEPELERQFAELQVDLATDEQVGLSTAEQPLTRRQSRGIVRGASWDNHRCLCQSGDGDCGKAHERKDRCVSGIAT